ncbi:N-acetylglucosaminyl deacetylase, LmbE family [Pricia antarctica]|uniref:N-acetylglucosaminyl deacetylase, LmbE family n=1 Tax=Pricia antarctica TaxID=641691 RepID=A0A1G6W755_9FLAO|nr:PIG-L deacetylase family protein [Pricia antarctica]SDD61648.1 N-acetylglucosaminyl deacetylase, LmbE family [Pricia antarctica]
MKKSQSIVWSGIIFLLVVLQVNHAIGQESGSNRVLMAIFAHPDDEMTVAPILSKYAKVGVKVYLVICTDGRYGTNDFTDHEAGEGLVAIRNEEMRCAAEKLGVELIHLKYHDQLKASEGYDGHVPHARKLIIDLEDIISEKKPDVIITWGPDGGSTHMDHRLVGASVTQVFISKIWDKAKKLYYVGTPSNLIEEIEQKKLAGIDSTYLKTRIEYSEEDAKKAMESLECHVSQVSPAIVTWREELSKKQKNTIYFREFVGPTEFKTELFD